MDWMKFANGELVLGIFNVCNDLSDTRIYFNKIHYMNANYSLLCLGMHIISHEYKIVIDKTINIKTYSKF